MRFKGFVALLIFIILFPLQIHADINNATQIPVILYHEIKTSEEKRLYSPNNTAVLDVDSFRKQMKYLSDNGYHTITVSEMRDFLAGKIQLPKKSVMIQFDDGLRGVYRYAYPIMKEYNLQGVVNIITERTYKDYGDEWDPSRNQYMNEDMLQAISSHFEFQSHLNNLHSLSNGTSYFVLKSKVEIIKDLLLSKERLSPFSEVSLFAYPFGQYNASSIEYLKEAGFDMAFTINRGYVKSWDDTMELNRISINPKVSFDQFKEIVSNTVAPIFSDIPLEHSNFEQTFWLYSNHIVKGYPDGSFKPNLDISRGQAAKMLVQALDIEVPEKVEEAPFSDMPLNYRDQYLLRVAAVLKKEGIFNGDNGAFKPKEVLTRQQMATVLVNAFHWKMEEETVEIKDLAKADKSHQENIQILAQKGVTVVPDGFFRPTEPTKRIHLASFLYKAVHLE